MEEGGGGRNGGVRLHVGGLGESVGRDDLLKIFSPMGSVDSVEFVRTKGRSFAYIDFSPTSENSLTKLFSTYNGCVWKGGKLRLEKAKEHYLARLKREWEEESSPPKDTIKAPEDSTPTTHLNMFFPRLRKVKALPFSGTGKHKYSFQRVVVPSSFPRTFCDCEEHNPSLTPRENHLRDMEALNVGINEEEVSIMNSVMTKLFEKNSISKSEEVPEEEQVPEEDQVPEEENEIEADQDNLVINVVSKGNDMRNSEMDIMLKKRKSSIPDETRARGGENTEGLKGDHIHPSKKRKSAILEESGRQESSQAIREKKKLSKVDPDKTLDEPDPSRTTDCKQLSDNISWSQKSSWKALVANGNTSNFSVSSFLPAASSGAGVQSSSPSSSTDSDGSPTSSEDLDVPISTARPIVITKSKKTKSKQVTSKIMEDEVERSDTTVNADGSDQSEDSFSDTSVEEPLELVVSSESDSENDKLNVENEETVAEDLNAENENFALEENVDHDVDEKEVGKGQLEACSKTTGGGSTWAQRAPWTQLVSEKNTSFSLTELFPDSNSDKPEAAKVINNGEGQSSGFNQSESGMQQSLSTGGFEAAGEHVFGTPARSLEENQQTLKVKNVSEGGRLAVKKPPIRRNTGSMETCTFMRSATSLREWAKAKKALSEPRRKKKSEE